MNISKKLRLTMIAQIKKSRCTIFAQFFVRFQQRQNFCDIVSLVRKIEERKIGAIEGGIKKFICGL